MNTILQIATDEYETTVTITNQLGLHARPAALVAKTAQTYSATTTLITSGKKADAKSILDILSLAACKGTVLTVHGKGNDAKDCVKSIADLVRLQFMEGSRDA